MSDRSQGPGEDLTPGDRQRLVRSLSRSGMLTNVCVALNASFTRADICELASGANGVYIVVSEYELQLGIELARSMCAAERNVGIAVEVAPETLGGIDQLFGVIRRERPDRVCFLFSSLELSIVEKRAAVDRIFHHARTNRGIYTGCSPMDAPYAWLVLESAGSLLAYRARRFLEYNLPPPSSTPLEIERNGTIRIFRGGPVLANVRDTTLDELWRGSGNVALARLHSRSDQVTGRCRSCRFLRTCGGGCIMRVALSGDLLASDPDCYLGETEI